MSACTEHSEAHALNGPHSEGQKGMTKVTES